MTKALTGIFGYPIEHSLSPDMQNAAFKHKKIDCVYVLFKIHPKDLKDAVRAIKVLGIRGVNITIPHKEKAAAFVDKLDPLAKKIGSINTIVNDNGILTGYNTDAFGFIKDLMAKGFNPKGKTAFLIGAGGAGKSIANALDWKKAKKIYLTDINEKAARELALKVPSARFVKYKMFKSLLKESDIIINATSVGMHSGNKSLIEPSLISKNVFVYDVVYNRETELIKAAKKAKTKSSGGIGMLIWQGAEAFSIWTGKKAPVNVMKKTLLKCLNKPNKRR